LIATILGIIAGILHLVAFAIYNKQMLEGTSRPNAATWNLWAFLTVLNCTSYFVMSTDWVKSFLPIASSFACVGTFFFALFKGKLSPLEKWDKVALTVGIISGLTWWVFKSATYANVVLQFSVLVSFIPTYQGVWKDSSKEKSLPWFIWAFAYVLILIVIWQRWQNQWQDLVYPVNCFFLHIGIGALAIRKSK
jgi:uncharacterized membrane protein YadS